jgi:hypothetical protein
MESRDWSRLARIVRERREDLGITQEQVAGNGGPSTATLRLIEGAAQETYRAKSLRQLEIGLRWMPGSVRSVLNGGDPVVQADEGGTPVQDEGPPHFSDPRDQEIADRYWATSAGSPLNFRIGMTYIAVEMARDSRSSTGDAPELRRREA